MDEEGGNNQFVGPYLVPFRNESGWVSAADDWQRYGFSSKDAMLRYVMQGDYTTETIPTEYGPMVRYKSASGADARPPSWQFWDDGGTWFDKALAIAIPAMATAGFGSGIGAALGAGAGAAGGAAGAAGGTAAEAAAAGALTAGEIGGASALGTGSAVGGGIGTAGSTLSASELASLGYTAEQMAALGVPASEIAASTAGAGAAGSYAGAPPDSYWGMQANADGVTPYTTNDVGYTYDPYTGDTVGAGNTPLDSNYFTTNPSLDSPGYGGNPSGGGLTGTDIWNFAKTALGTPGVSQLLAGGLNSVGGYLASRQQANAAGAANDLLWRQYLQNREDLTPYRLAGYGALGNVVNLVTPGRQFNQMQLDPGYQFRKEEGQQALDNRLRAGGKFYSGSAIKAGADYNQNFASNEFDKVFNRNAAVAGIGQTATNTGAQLGASTAQQAANNTVDIGNARASGYAAGFGGISNALNQYSQAQQTQQLLDLLSKKV